jgi:ABC-type Fe3+/spermidine/putrescine transport system ATPase subunit
VNETILRLCEVSRFYGPIRAVSRVSLEIREGELFALLGPSGCGKSTTLRLVTGLERPDEGEIYVRNEVLSSVPRRIFVPPHKRNMGMVFQSYAIWPHLTVFENVAYPLRAQGVRGRQLEKKVHNVLELVGLAGVGDRPGPLLSGGQQQRVALARALVYEPQILLLDEPFSNLDAKLREQMRLELKQLQRRVGITVVFVTHDQEEALSLSDRIAVMESGEVAQVGLPQELYERPGRPFIRDFLGKSVVLQGEVARLGSDHRAEIQLVGDLRVTLAVPNTTFSSDSVGQRVLVAIRPEDILVEEGAAGDSCNRLEGTIAEMLFLGDRYECHIRVGGQEIILYFPRSTPYREGQPVRVHFPPSALSVWKQKQ